MISQLGTWYPVLACDRVFMLPGVPELFRAQLEAVLMRVEGKPLFLRALYLGEGEAEIAAAVDRVALSMPGVAIGSYPTFDRSAGYQVKLTLEAGESELVEQAMARLVQELPGGSVLRTE
jgi:molybdopterin-biosynthesis enzyme MoeA-like protein